MTRMEYLNEVIRCLNLLVEGDDVDPLTRAAYAIMRDVCLNLSLDMQVENREAA